MVNEQRANPQQTKMGNNIVKTDHVIYLIIIITLAECKLCLVLEIFVDRYGVGYGVQQ